MLQAAVAITISAQGKEPITDTITPFPPFDPAALTKPLAGVAGGVLSNLATKIIVARLTATDFGVSGTVALTPGESGGVLGETGSVSFGPLTPFVPEALRQFSWVQDVAPEVYSFYQEAIGEDSAAFSGTVTFKAV